MSGFFDEQLKKQENFNNQASMYTPNFGAYVGARFEQGRLEGSGFRLRDAIDFSDPFGRSLEAKTYTGQEAMDKFGLINIDPKGLYSHGAIMDLVRRQGHLITLRNTESQYRGGFWGRAAGLGASFAGLASDPVELGVSLIPIGGPIEKGILAAKTGGKTLSKPGLAERFLARNPNTSIFSNPMLRHAVEGAGGNLLVSPVTAMTSTSLGEPYGPADLGVDVAAGAVLGGTLGIAGELINRGTKAWRNQSSVAAKDLRLEPTTNEILQREAMEQWNTTGTVDLAPILQKEARRMEQQHTDLADALDNSTSPADIPAPQKQVLDNMMTTPERQLLDAMQSDAEAAGRPRAEGAISRFTETIQGHVDHIVKNVNAAVDAIRAGESPQALRLISELQDVSDALSIVLPKKEIDRINKVIDKLQDPETAGQAKRGLNNLTAALQKAADDAQAPVPESGASTPEVVHRAMRMRDELIGRIQITKDPDKLARMQNSLDALNKFLKEAGGVSDWDDVRAMGIDVDAILKDFPELAQLKPNVAYKRMKDAMMSKVHALQQYKAMADPVSGEVREPLELNLAKQMQEDGTEVKTSQDLAKFSEQRLKEVDTDFERLKEFARFDQARLNSLKKLEEKYREGLARTNAINEGAPVAFLCVQREGIQGG